MPVSRTPSHRPLRRAFQWDLARQVERLDWLLMQLPRYAEWGYNELYLHLEDAVQYPSLPGVARADAYTYGQLETLVHAAQRVGIGVVPIVNLLGHTQYLVKVPELRDLNELRAADGSPQERGQICPVHPRTLEIAGKLLDDMAPFCTAGKVHVGLDESFSLGRHPLSQREVKRIGLAAHFARYVGRLRDLTGTRGLEMGLWADMLYFLPEAIPLLPTDVAAYEWYYYPFARRPNVEFFNFAESDVGEQLIARGIEYWGCPMNGAFRFEPLPHFGDRLANIVSWWRRCQRLKAAGMLVTSWEPYRLAMELTTVVDAAAASLWLDDEQEPRAMLERGFARVFGKAKGRKKAQKSQKEDRLAAKVALACDRYPFGGYPRWQVNSRWDVISRREPVEVYGREEKHFRELARQARGLPAPLRASVELRCYLAFREAWLRRMHRVAGAPRYFGGGPAGRSGERQRDDQVGVSEAAAFRAAWRVGLAAARTMWSRTRDPHTIGANEQILQGDLSRLDALLRGEPVLGGPWQLCYRVDNLAPACQLVLIEQRQADGSWKTLQACHTIEFQGRAAVRRGGLVREHAAPVTWDGDLDRLPELRVAVRGVGHVRVGRFELRGSAEPNRRGAPLRYGRGGERQRFDSVIVSLRPKTKILGQPAPRRGFPVIDWSVNVDSVDLIP